MEYSFNRSGRSRSLDVLAYSLICLTTFLRLMEGERYSFTTRRQTRQSQVCYKIQPAAPHYYLPCSVVRVYSGDAPYRSCSISLKDPDEASDCYWWKWWCPEGSLCVLSPTKFYQTSDSGQYLRGARVWSTWYEWWTQCSRGDTGVPERSDGPRIDSRPELGLSTTTADWKLHEHTQELHQFH